MSGINNITIGIMLLSIISFAQAPPKPVEQSLPCDFQGELYPTKSKPRWFTSNEMKRRATKKVDVGPLMKQADIAASNIKISLIIAANGKIKCLRINSQAHPIIRIEVDRAIKQWEFQPLIHNGKPIPYVGFLEFELCGMNCPQGRHMTLIE